MQSFAATLDIIQRDRPDLSLEEQRHMAATLMQLTECSLHSAVAQDVDEAGWKTARGAGIGGSEIACIIGESEYAGPLTIWQRKVFGDNDYHQSEPARWGNLLESVIIAEWAKRTGRKYIRLPVNLRSNKHEFALANVDAFEVGDETLVIEGITVPKLIGICEVKTTSTYNKELWDEGEIPYAYVCQTNWYQEITGLHTCEIICLVGGQKLYSYPVPYIEDLVERMFTGGRKFWYDHIVAMVPPEPTAADEDTVLSSKEFEEEGPPVILEDDTSDNLVEAYIATREKISELKKLQDALKVQIYARIGNSRNAITSGHTITISQAKRKSCDLEALATYYPRAYATCVKTTVSNKFTVK